MIFRKTSANKCVTSIQTLVHLLLYTGVLVRFTFESDNSWC